MQRERFHYLIGVQYLGFRYSGWQKQPNQKTIEHMILKTLRFVLPDCKSKVLAAGRTDAKVSALGASFELFVDRPLSDLDSFLREFNKNLPPDIRALKVDVVDKGFNIIQDSKRKEYVYLFSFGEKNHPFCAPFLTNIIEPLDIEGMKAAAPIFEGQHDFSSFTTGTQVNSRRQRTVEQCVIRENTLLSANFFPQKSYALHIVSPGFMRYQVRMIMGALFELGRGKLTLDDIKNSLAGTNAYTMTAVAPGSGLLLNKLEFN